jgi:hypothetical protein
MAPYFQFPEEDHPHVTIKNVSIAMRDGVKLAATVFRPSFDGQTPVSERLPVVLHRCVELWAHMVQKRGCSTLFHSTGQSLGLLCLLLVLLQNTLQPKQKCKN